MPGIRWWDRSAMAVRMITCREGRQARRAAERRHSRFALVLVAMGIMAQEPLSAQTCFQARPLPRCRNFGVTEFGVLQRIGGTSALGLSGALGVMRNIDASTAVGAVLFVESDEFSSAGGLRVRYRRWLTGGNSGDIAVGLGHHSEAEGLYPTVEATVNVLNMISLVVQVDAPRVEVTRYGPLVTDGYTQRREAITGHQRELQYGAGARLNRWPGFVGLLAAAGLGALVAATW
jgi:hypothetical protein